MDRRTAEAFGLAVVSLALIVGGPALSWWMIALPAIETSCGPGCTQSHESPLEQPWVGAILFFIGIGLMAVAWRLDRRPAGAARRGWRDLTSWAAPLLWLAVLPLVAGPATYLIAAANTHDQSCQVYAGYVGGGGSDCPVSVYLPSVVLPGLLNLVPMWWLRNANGRRLIAAAVASALGLAGFAVSVVVLYSLGPTVSWNFGFLIPVLPPQQERDLGFGLVLWLLAIIALLVIAKLPVRAGQSGRPSVTSNAPG